MARKTIWITRDDWGILALTGDRMWYLDGKSPRGQAVLNGLWDVRISTTPWHKQRTLWSGIYEHFVNFAVEFSDQAFADLQEIMYPMRCS